MKTSISVGIPAFNEEENLRMLLRALLKQKEEGFKLKEIIVISDKSTDGTDKIVKGFKNRKIILFRNTKRVGAALSQNRILNLFRGDVLLILNADVVIYDGFFIKKLLESYQSVMEVGIVCPKVMPISASNFFERVINYSVNYKKKMFCKLNSGNNIYHCIGVARLISKEFAKKLKWPKTISEDAYSYLECIRLGFRFIYNPNTEIYYKSPSNLKDHLNQSIRYLSSKDEMKKYFNSDLISRSYKIPIFIIISATFEYLFKNPYMFLSYLSIHFLANVIGVNHKNVNATWAVSKSSKSFGSTNQ